MKKNESNLNKIIAIFLIIITFLLVLLLLQNTMPKKSKCVKYETYNDFSKCKGIQPIPALGEEWNSCVNRVRECVEWENE